MTDRRVIIAFAAAALAAIVAAPASHAQGRGAPQSPATASAKASAPIDLTGYWVSYVTEDWRYRMVTPPKGDYASVPITVEAKRVADGWDPDKDERAGEACRSFGAAAIMRVPAHVHVTWQDENTLKVEIDAGTQTRLLHFGSWKAPAGPATWSGDSVATWETAGGANAAGRGDAAPKFGALKVITTHMRPGYLRKNGVPYSADAKMTEYWDLNKEKSGDQWLTITTLIDDPKYLQIQWVTSPNFKREGDGSKWDPTPCSAKW